MKLSSPAALAALGLAASLGPACATESAKQPAEEIVVCGKRIPVGVPVVLWSDPEGYDAYQPGPVLSEKGPVGLRYAPSRAWAENEEDLDLEALRGSIDQLVLHYDACGFSRRCFRLLHDERMLSAHFLLDVDGTLYQTLDLREQAWHGRFTNARSIGIEIAQIGVYDPDDATNDPWQKRRWYVRDGERLRLEIPDEYGDPHIRAPGPFYAARNEPVAGSIHGHAWEQADFTPDQYATLTGLVAGLRQVFPRIELDAPRTPEGDVRTDQLTRTEIDAFRGILGHYHITTERNDPGPAFDWEKLLSGVRRLEEQAKR